jgi:hypothetical protein
MEEERRNEALQEIEISTERLNPSQTEHHESDHDNSDPNEDDEVKRLHEHCLIFSRRPWTWMLWSDWMHERLGRFFGLLRKLAGFSSLKVLTNMCFTFYNLYA